MVDPGPDFPACRNCEYQQLEAGKLYCHKARPFAQAVMGMAPPKASPIVTGAPPRPSLTPEIRGVATCFPEVQPEWFCWEHPVLADRIARRNPLYQLLLRVHGASQELLDEGRAGANGRYVPLGGIVVEGTSTPVS
jgi:hypothetical protein